MRDEFLVKVGYRVLRFWNNEIDDELDGVLEAIIEALKVAPPGRYAATLP